MTQQSIKEQLKALLEQSKTLAEQAADAADEDDETDWDGVISSLDEATEALG